jgi:hypothetical protein
LQAILHLTVQRLMGTPAILERYPRTDDDARLAAFDIELQMVE